MKISEVRARSIIVKSRIPGTDYVINPYRGCAHDCAYCYASYMARFTGRSPSDWGKFVDAKVNAGDLLPRDLAKVPSGSHVLLSSVTDPYQPAESKYRLARSCLEGLSKRADVSVSILTKSDLVCRDADVIAELPGAEVGFTVTSVDDRVCAAFENGAPSGKRRLEALSRIADSGLSSWGFLGPVLPGFSEEEDIYQVLRGFRESGAGYVLVDAFSFYSNCTARFLSAVGRYFPDRHRKAVKEARSPELHRQRVRAYATRAAEDLGLEIKLVF